MVVNYRGAYFPTRHTNVSMKKKCVKIYSRGPKFLDRMQVQDILVKQLKIGESKIIYLYKLDRAREWYAILDSEEYAQQCVSAGTIAIDSENSLSFERITHQRINVKVHWLPPFIEDDFLFEFLSEFGEVLDISREWSRETKNYTGQRHMKMIVSEENRAAIPHTAQWNNGMKILLTMPGREPLCLKCGSLGHLRKFCQPRLNNPSYADALRTISATSDTVVTPERETNTSSELQTNSETIQPSTTEALDLSKTSDVTVSPTIQDNTIPADNSGPVPITPDVTDPNETTGQEMEVSEKQDDGFSTIGKKGRIEKDSISTTDESATKKQKTCTEREKALPSANNTVVVLPKLIGVGSIFEGDPHCSDISDTEGSWAGSGS